MDFNSMVFNAPLVKVVILGFAAIGLLSVSRKVVSYIRLLLSLFVLSGKNVSTLTARIPLHC